MKIRHTHAHQHTSTPAHTARTVVKQFSLLHAKFARQTNAVVGPAGPAAARGSGSGSGKDDRGVTTAGCQELQAQRVAVLGPGHLALVRLKFGFSSP